MIFSRHSIAAYGFDPADVARVAAALVLGLCMFHGSAAAHSPHDDAEVIVLSPQFEDDQTMFCAFYARCNYLVKSTDGGLTWLPSQNGLSPQQIKDLAISPEYHSDQTLFAGSRGDGIYTSNNGGLSWHKSNTGIFDLEVATLAISPAFGLDGTIFAGTESGRVFRSCDGGLNWSACSAGLPGKEITALLFSPGFLQDRLLFAGTLGGGVFMSNDDATGWTACSTGLKDFDVTTLAISPEFGSDGTLFAGTYAGGVFQSIDRGQSWLEVNDGISDKGVVRIAVSPFFGSDRTLICVSNDTGAFKSTDGGGFWTLNDDGLEYRASQTDLHFKGAVFSPDYFESGTVFVWMFEGLFRSTNRGRSYFQLDIYPQTIVRSMVVSPEYASDSSLFAATNGGGVYRSTDGGTTWETKNTGLSFRFLSPIAISPAYGTDDTVWTGTLNSVNKSFDRGDHWIPFKGDPSSNYFLSRSLGVSPDYSHDGTIYTGNLHSGEYALYKSSDGGLTYQPVPITADAVAAIAFSPDFASDGILYLGTNDGVLVSTDSGVSFEPTAMLLDVESVAVSPAFSTDRTLFVGEHFGGVHKSTNGGKTWIVTSFGLPDNVAVTQLLLSPGYASDRTLFISTVSCGVFQSVDAGASWFLKGLEGHYMRCMALSSNYSQDGVVFAGCWDGVYQYSPDGVWRNTLQLTRYEQTCDQVLTRGTWEVFANLLLSEHSILYSDEIQTSLTFSFVGRSIDWIGPRASNLGVAALYLDDVFIATVDQYNSRTQWQQVLYSFDQLDDGLHRLRISVTGMAHPDSAGTYVAVDAFDVRKQP